MIATTEGPHEVSPHLAEASGPGAIDSAIDATSGSPAAEARNPGDPAMPAILIVDDEFGIAEMSAELLSYLGYSAGTAIDGASALTSVEQAPPDLILLDVMMPVLSGIDVLLTLKADARYRDIPVILMSAAGAEVVPAELRPQIAGFLLKPFTFDELKAAVRTALPGAA